MTGYLDQLKSAAERASDMAYRSGEEFLHALIKAMLESHRLSPNSIGRQPSCGSQTRT